jgi:hypothetical protein
MRQQWDSTTQTISRNGFFPQTDFLEIIAGAVQTQLKSWEPPGTFRSLCNAHKNLFKLN